MLGTMISGEDMLLLVEKECGFAPIAKASVNVELIQRGDLIFALELHNMQGISLPKTKAKISFTAAYKDFTISSTK